MTHLSFVFFVRYIISLSFGFSCCRSFHDLDFGGGEGVKVIDQGVNLAIQAVAAVGVKILVLVALRPGQLLFGRQHLLDQFNHPVVPCFVGEIGKLRTTVRFQPAQAAQRERRDHFE